MFHSIEKNISARVSSYVRTKHGVEVASALEQPKQSSFGELAIPVAFHLAPQLKQAPRAIAAELVGAHDGQIHLVEGTIGATFRITIPDRPVELLSIRNERARA